MRSFRVHRLRLLPSYFEAVVSGEKAFEIRFNDRDFRVGDKLILKEWNPLSRSYSGRFVEREVTYILHGGELGLLDGFCILSIQSVEYPIKLD